MTEPTSGKIFNSPHIRLRVGCYGYFYEFPANEVFELPEGIVESDDTDVSENDHGIDFYAE
jgi:hypothetical protein